MGEMGQKGAAWLKFGHKKKDFFSFAYLAVDPGQFPRSTPGTFMGGGQPIAFFQFLSRASHPGRGLRAPRVVERCPAWEQFGDKLKEREVCLQS